MGQGATRDDIQAISDREATPAHAKRPAASPEWVLQTHPWHPSTQLNMFHLFWYILIGLIAGVISKSVMHVHMTLFWTIVLGMIGSIIGGAITHIFARPTNERFHPAGLIFSSLGAILVLYICFKLRIHFPNVSPL